MNVQQLDNFHKSRTAYVVFGIVELAIAYALGSLAIDRGTWWWWILTLIFLVGGVQNLVKLIAKVARNR